MTTTANPRPLRRMVRMTAIERTRAATWIKCWRNQHFPERLTLAQAREMIWIRFA